MFDIGSRIIALRNLHNISANKLSKELNVDPSTINKIEKGTAKPSIDLLFKICSYFNITLAEFFDTQTSDLPPDLLQLIETAKKLTPKERQKITELIQTFLETRSSSIVLPASSLKGELRYKIAEHFSKSPDANEKA
ncbi:helix-turn-helix family protein [Anoxybacillus sp. B7M1]|uniref:helix-turn-helix domain-containing protein n=1 Tax=unclassified Anoxybacillus TaxID=2639704 RepID=UPI0007B5EDD8|nr:MULTISPECIES: helix-turn-helix domain-containing protein [unclassified Anoxybacillus]ANB56253.1 helix-turn-helix family protein [Anoxybacillus sp. B2M1]ANB62985.1 helix-turn-helix family protein [Anoxybacillus sp. B7M1]